MKQGRDVELPEDFWIPIPLETNNITSLSPFLVPQDHLASSGVYYAMALYMLFMFIVGTFINALTVTCTRQNKKLRSHLNYILMNLAVSNLLVSCVDSLTAFLSFANKYFILGPLACKIEGFIATLGGMVSRSLAVVAFERWLVIGKPLGHFIFKPDHCVFTWVFALIASAPPLPIFGWSRYIPEGLQCSCATIVFCYSQLLVTLKMAAQAESASTQKAEREVTRMVVIMVFGFLVCWLPYGPFALWVVNNRGQTFDLRLAS
ncbi:hypothetical protein KUCAC02_030123, partial [Chaenocephalus aceratus]